MKFKQQKSSSIPEVNLVPMIDVLMSVLIFFIIMSMTLIDQNFGNINIPSGAIRSQSNSDNKKTVQNLIIGLDKEGDFFIADKIINENELLQQIEEFLDKNPSGEVIIKADKDLSYRDIAQFLNKMGTIESQQVFLAIDEAK